VAVVAALGLYMALTPTPAPSDEQVAVPPTAAAPPALAAPAAPEPASAQVPHPEPGADEEHAAPPTAAIGTEAVMLPVRAGPLDELKHAFETEPRASTARDLELRVEAELKKPDIPAGLFRSVLCRSSVCRIQMRWRPERVAGYNIALVRMLHIFGMGVGADPAAPDKDNEVELDMYMKRAPEPG
jgi:hypothetical protein